jgi:hypothetical protein
MKKHLPSLQESLELLALALMVAGLQFVIQSWGWTALFVVGFIWNWSVLNGWVGQRVSEKKYRFSVLRGISLFHRGLIFPFKNYPKIKEWAQVLPAAMAFGLLSFMFNSNIPWWAALLGSLSFLIIRRQISYFHS